MSRNYRICTIIAAVVLCIVVFCLSTSVGQDRRRYEVETQVYGVPAYQSDAARAIEAYERLMERYLDLTERNLVGLEADVKIFTDKLDTIDAKLSTLDTRLERIEQYLGIAPMTIPSAAPDPNGLRHSMRSEVTRPISPDMP